jgi:predicted NACHT family NTPase
MARRMMIKQLRERNFILCYLGADNYAFVHRTFLEFFAAWAFVWEFKETQTLSFEELARSDLWISLAGRKLAGNAETDCWND